MSLAHGVLGYLFLGSMALLSMEVGKRLLDAWEEDHQLPPDNFKDVLTKFFVLQCAFWMGLILWPFVVVRNLLGMRRNR